MEILIVDDDPLTLEALASCIQLEGFQAICADNGFKAIELWKANQPALVCLDIMMPGKDGYNVCKTIRKTDKETPILFLSAKNQEEDIAVGLNIGADDFIRKPFTRIEVMARIRAALRRTSLKKTAQHFQLQELKIQPLQLIATRGKQFIDLTPREVSILKLLSQHTTKKHC